MLLVFDDAGRAPVLSTPDVAHRRSTRAFALTQSQKAEETLQCWIARLTYAAAPELPRGDQQKARVDELEARPPFAHPDAARSLVVGVHQGIDQGFADGPMYVGFVDAVLAVLHGERHLESVLQLDDRTPIELEHVGVPHPIGVNTIHPASVVSRGAR